MPGPPAKQAHFLTGICPDEKCHTKLYFPSHNISIECPECGQRHEHRSILEVQPVTDLSSAMMPILRNILLGSRAVRKGPEMIKVLGLNNYHCRLVSPLLTIFGVDKRTGGVVPIHDISSRDTFDCSLLGERAFLIDPQHINVPGYGRDVSGSRFYLANTMSVIQAFNDGEERLVPIHAEGDGHCLVHAISRALVGRELFWHALRCDIKKHFETNLHKYKELLKEFVDENEWEEIIAECDPEFQPAKEEPLGLRNIHVFGLANVLKRPIILLDSLQGMSSSGDYSAVFLPGLVQPRDCRGKSGELNKPLCLAWSSGSRSHYIPLVGVKGLPLPRFPRAQMPKVWGVSQSLLNDYIEFHPGGWCVIGGDRSLNESYVSRLVSAMDGVFLRDNGVHPALVADVAHHIFKRSGVVGVHPTMALSTARRAVEERRLFRCLSCDAICEQRWRPEWLTKGGLLYNLAQQQATLAAGKIYQFPTQGIKCRYDPEADELILDKDCEPLMEQCIWCYSPKLRHVRGDNSVEYLDGDKTKTRSHGSHCRCGFMHWWDGEEYDNLPQQIAVTFTWSGKTVTEKVPWFQHESDASRNSNVYEAATKTVYKHFPGAFGSERIVQNVVEQILEQTKSPEAKIEQTDHSKLPNTRKEEPPTKMIITGVKTLHKEELGLSKTEHRIKENIEKHAAQDQARASDERRRRAVDESAGKGKPFRAASTGNVAKVAGKEGAEKAVQMKEAPKKPNSSSRADGRKVVRMVTSDGKQAQLTLSKNAAYAELTQHIESVGLVNMASVQKIMYGFPPKEIKAPASDDDDLPLPLQNGDRIQVVLLSEPSPPPPLPAAPQFNLEREILRCLGSMKGSGEGAGASETEDGLDASIATLVLTVSLLGSTMWEYAQKYPELFKRGGLFYRQMQRDVGLEHGKHSQIPGLPGKTLRYNGETDQLELCVGSVHHPIGPGLDQRLKEAAEASSQSEVQPAGPSVPHTFGTVIGHTEEKVSPFSGTGYVLNAPTGSMDTESGDEKGEDMEVGNQGNKSGESDGSS